jgi:TRAP-type C4-dicarboxylate transport system substrate-binding protein
MPTISRRTSIALLAAALVAASPAALADTFKWRIGAGHPVQGIAHVTAVEEFFIPEVTKQLAAMGHKVEWTKAWGGSVAKLPEVLEATRSGLLDIGVVNFPFHSAQLFTNNFPFYFPFQPSDHVLAVRAVRATYDEVPWLYEVFERRYNQKHLGVGQNGDYGVGTRVQVKVFEDLKSKKIGAAGPNLNWFRGTGIVGVQTNLNEAYNALQSGVYEGLVIFPGPYFGFKLNEVGKFYLNAGLGAPAAIAVTINLDTWKGLPKPVQDVLVKVGRAYDVANAEMQQKADREGLDKLRAAGVQVLDLPLGERTKWASVIATLPNDMAKDANKRGEPGTQVFRAYIANLKKLGYSFPAEYKID